MILRVDADLALPVYEQIREQITRMAVTGTLTEGTRMPTIRQLANDLKLAKGTVAKAYALLESSGVVESRGHKGTFLAAIAPGEGLSRKAVAGELGAAADAFVVAARQLGVTGDEAVAAVQRHWIEP